MAWGRKNKPEPRHETQPEERPLPPPPKPVEAAARIGEKTTVTGDVRADESLYIAGRVEGKVICTGQLIIDRQGAVMGEIECASVAVHGEARGDVRAHEQIVIEATGRLIGDIYTKVFTHHPGGFFQGYSHMLEERPAREKPPSKKAKTAPEPVAAPVPEAKTPAEPEPQPPSKSAET